MFFSRLQWYCTWTTAAIRQTLLLLGALLYALFHLESKHL